MYNVQILGQADHCFNTDMKTRCCSSSSVKCIAMSHQFFKPASLYHQSLKRSVISNSCFAPKSKLNSESEERHRYGKDANFPSCIFFFLAYGLLGLKEEGNFRVGLVVNLAIDVWTLRGVIGGFITGFDKRLGVVVRTSCFWSNDAFSDLSDQDWRNWSWK